MRPPLLVLAGPTGTGKSEAAVLLAERLGGEIVGCDALQVYRGLDAGTAKPDPAWRVRVRHHLIDCVDPRTDFNVADYVRAAEQAAREILSRGRLPIVVGGSGLYLRGLLRGLIDAPGRDPELRARLRAIAARRGSKNLHRWLTRLDPDSARRLPAGDGQRILRALELALSEGPAWSERLRATGTWASSDERFDTLKLGLDLEREALFRRLDERVERFFAAGLVAEVQSLLERGVPHAANAFKAIGYREVLSAIDRGDDPDETRTEVRRRTRRYAKRQRTWFRKEPKLVWLDAGAGTEAVVTRAIELWQGRRAR